MRGIRELIMRIIKLSLLDLYSGLLASGLVLCAAGLAEAADISTHSFNSGLNCYGVYPLPDTGQTASYTATFGEDHDYQPAAVQPRYTILNPVGISSVTVDNITGLMWITNPVDAGISGIYTWENAMNACENQVGGAGTYATYSDWRLPHIKELVSIVDYSLQNPSINTTYFLNTVSNFYLSSDTYVLNVPTVLSVGFSNGNISNPSKTTPGAYVRCVRGGP